MDEVPRAGFYKLDHAPARALHRFALREGDTHIQGDDQALIGAVLDVETTGRTCGVDKIIELAVRRFRYNAAGEITAIGRCYSWLEDPGVPLTSEIQDLTGLTDRDLEGAEIDERAAERVLSSASVIIAHNAAFDRPFVEARLPDIRGLPWACSCHEIDWRARGLKARSLECLLCKVGWEHDGHRAQVDVDGLLHLLGHRNNEGQTALRELLDRAGAPGVRLWADGANIDLKDVLKSRGYRFDWACKTWFRDLPVDQHTSEQGWLETNIYVASARPRAFGPRSEPIDWSTRWS